MKKIIFLLPVAIGFFAACNNAETTEETAVEETVTDTVTVAEEVTTEQVVNMPATEFWQNLQSLGGLENIAPDMVDTTIVDGQGVGATRTIVLAGEDAGEVQQRVVTLDSTQMVAEFEILSSPFPVTDLFESFDINPQDDSSSVVVWTFKYEVTEENREEMRSMFEDLQRDFLTQLNNKGAATTTQLN